MEEPTLPEELQLEIINMVPDPRFRLVCKLWRDELNAVYEREFKEMLELYPIFNFDDITHFRTLYLGDSLYDSSYIRVQTDTTINFMLMTSNGHFIITDGVKYEIILYDSKMSTFKISNINDFIARNEVSTDDIMPKYLNYIKEFVRIVNVYKHYGMKKIKAYTRKSELNIN
jgi:hypothetical protein